MQRKKSIPLVGTTIFLTTMITLSGCTNQNNGDTNLTPARDVTGNWSDSPIFIDRANECAYEGTMKLTIEQEGTSVSGYFDLTVIKRKGIPLALQSDLRFAIF